MVTDGYPPLVESIPVRHDDRHAPAQTPRAEGVRAIAAQYGYVPNAWAANLRRKRPWRRSSMRWTSSVPGVCSCSPTSTGTAGPSDDRAGVRGDGTRFFADTALSGSAIGIRCGLEFFGVDQVVFGSDCPFAREGGSLYIREIIRVIDELELDHADREKIYSGNLLRLMQLPPVDQ